MWLSSKEEAALRHRCGRERVAWAHPAETGATAAGLPHAGRFGGFLFLIFSTFAHTYVLSKMRFRYQAINLPWERELEFLERGTGLRATVISMASVKTREEAVNRSRSW